MLSSLRAVCLILILALLTAMPSPAGADASNFSGLKGEDLKPRADLQELAIDLILGGGKGKIERVSVVEDRADSLTVTIAYSGLSTGEPLIMNVSAQDGKLRRVDGVKDVSEEVSGPSGEATVVLTMDDGIPEGTEYQQDVLSVNIGKKGKFKKEATQTFNCSKKWQKAISPENLVVNVTASPIGKSRSLPATENGSPGKVVLTPILKPAIHARPTAGKAITPTTTIKTIRVLPTAKIITPTPAPAPSPSPTPAKTTSSTVALPTMKVFKRLDLVAGLPQDVKDNNGKGPSAQAIRLFDVLDSDIGLSSEDVTDLHPNVYEDANPESGFFYYLPRAYYLQWDEDFGYGLRILYGASAGDTDNPVSIAARLTSGIDGSDVSLVKESLKQYCSSAGRKFKDLKPFPFSSMSVSLKGDLGQYNIPPDKISVTGISDIAGMIEISFTTDPVTKENLQMVLTEGLGINGLVTYQSAGTSGSDALEVSIPVSIKFADRHSFGSRAFRRSSEFRNNTPHPMKLKNINVLMSEGSPTVYSFDLGSAVVPAGARAAIDARKIPAWVDSSKKTLKTWVDYAPASDEESMAEAIEEVTGGVTSVAQSSITIRTLSPLADTGVALVLVTVTSKYFDPKASTDATKSVELTADGTAYEVGPIYLVDRQPGDVKPGDPLFKFRLTVVNPDGTTKEGTQWVESNNLTVYVGQAQLEPILTEE